MIPGHCGGVLSHWRESNGLLFCLRMGQDPPQSELKGWVAMFTPLGSTVVEENPETRIGLMWIVASLGSEGVGLPYSYSGEGGLWVDRA